MLGTNQARSLMAAILPSLAVAVAANLDQINGMRGRVERRIGAAYHLYRVLFLLLSFLAEHDTFVRTLNQSAVPWIAATPNYTDK